LRLLPFPPDECVAGDDVGLFAKSEHGNVLANMAAVG